MWTIQGNILFGNVNKIKLHVYPLKKIPILSRENELFRKAWEPFIYYLEHTDLESILGQRSEDSQLCRHVSVMETSFPTC